MTKLYLERGTQLEDFFYFYKIAFRFMGQVFNFITYNYCFIIISYFILNKYVVLLIKLARKKS